MRVFTVVLLALLFPALMLGCSGGNAGSQSADSPAQASSSEASADGAAEQGDGGSLTSVGEWPESEAISVVPRPSFSFSPVSISESENYTGITYEQADESEVAAWIEEVKNAGFVENASESRGSTYSYHAANAEGVTISVQYVSASNIQPKLLIQIATLNTVKPS